MPKKLVIGRQVRRGPDVIARVLTRLMNVERAPAGGVVEITKYQGSGGGSPAAAASGGHTIEDEGVALTQRTGLNFVGAGVTVTDDPVNDESVVTIPGGGGGGGITDSFFSA